MPPFFTETDTLRILEANYDHLESWAVEAYQHLHEGRVTQKEFDLYTSSEPHGRMISMGCVIEGLCSGHKWITSFEENIDAGFERGEATVVLTNITRISSGESVQQLGRTLAVLEAEAITRYRTVTGAIAVLRKLKTDLGQTPLCLIGCGALQRIFAEYWVRKVGLPARWHLHDIRKEQAEKFKIFLQSLLPGHRPEILIFEDNAKAMQAQTLVSFSTTAKEPYIHSLEALDNDAALLLFSLRDLSPSCMLGHRHIADDKKLTSSKKTSLAWAMNDTTRAPSLDLASVEEYADVLFGPPVKDRQGFTIISPFGLPCLDIWYASRILSASLLQGLQ